MRPSLAELERVVAHGPGTLALCYKGYIRPLVSSRGAPNGSGPLTSSAVLPPPKARGPWGSRTALLGNPGYLCWVQSGRAQGHAMTLSAWGRGDPQDSAVDVEWEEMGFCGTPSCGPLLSMLPLVPP